jgi:hypothetical protein
MLFVAILMAMSYSFARAAFMTARVDEVKSEAQEATVMAVDVLTREVRMAGFSAAAQPLAGVSSAAPERVEVASDLDGDGDTADTNELIAYSYDAVKQQLMRATGGGSPQPFVLNVPAGGVQFTFYDAGGTALPAAAGGLTAGDRGRIRRIDVRVHVALGHPDPTVVAPVTSTVWSTMCLRNQ